jgi:hypothetical protein
MIHDSALIEIANELVHSVFTPQLSHALDAIVRIAEDAHLAVEILVLDVLDPRQDLAKRLEALDVGLAERPQPLRGLP